MTYAEYLVSQGASPEEVAVLDKPVARKAFERSEAIRMEAEALKEQVAKDKAELNGWFNNTAVPEYKEMERRTIAAESEAAKARQAWQSAQERGLIDVAQLESLGYSKKADEHVADKTNPPFDASKYLTVDSVKGVAKDLEFNLARFTDIVMEHQQLFPGRPLKAGELTKEAQAADKTPEQFWMEKYGVIKAREEREQKTREAYDTKLREEGRQTAIAELAGKYANPDARPLSPSISFLVPRSATGRDKQPWERRDDASSDRVARATQKLIERTHQGVTN